MDAELSHFYKFKVKIILIGDTSIGTGKKLSNQINVWGNMFKYYP